MPPETVPPTTSPAALAPVSDLLERVRSRFSRLFSTLFPWLVISCIGGLATSIGDFIGVHLNPFVYIVGGIIGLLLMFTAYVAEARIVAEIETDPKDITGHAQRALSVLLPYIWMVIIQGFVMVGAGIAFFVPFVILNIFLTVSAFVLIVENIRGINALVRSCGYVAGRWWPTFWRMVVMVFLLLIILAVVGLVLTLGFGPRWGHGPTPWGATLIQQLVSAFLLGPLMLCYLFELYQDLRRTKPATIETEEKTARRWLVIFLIIGIIGALLGAFLVVAAVKTLSQNPAITGAGVSFQSSYSSQ